MEHENQTTVVEMPKSQPRSDESVLTAFSAIVDFVNSLWSVYSSKSTTPLALYRRITQKVSIGDRESMEKAVSGFREFFLKHMKDLRENSVSPDTIIYYGKGGRIYIEVGRFLANKSISDTVKEHLFGIAGILYPEEIGSLLDTSMAIAPIVQ